MRAGAARKQSPHHRQTGSGQEKAELKVFHKSAENDMVGNFGKDAEAPARCPGTLQGDRLLRQHWERQCALFFHLWGQLHPSTSHATLRLPLTLFCDIFRLEKPRGFFKGGALRLMKERQDTLVAVL